MKKRNNLFLNKKRLGVALVAVFFPGLVFSQHRRAMQLETKVEQAVNVARPASVRLWGFDTLLRQRTSGQFSGVVVKGGYILTAAHVSQPGDTYKVMFPDGREGIAKALGKIEFAEDKTRPDVALMKIITKGNWPYAEMGSSANLRAFEPCISISYPESLDQSQPTLRFGYVSEPHVARGFIKSTCIMEPGDSGGPLFDCEGRVIGLHSAIEVPERDNYDVPIDLYKKYWTALNETISYHSLPEKEDAIGPPGAIRPPVYPGLKDMPAFTGVNKKYKNSCVTIVSKLDGKQQKITGTLFSLQGTSLLKIWNGPVIVTKSSMVGDTGITILDHSKTVKAFIIGRDKSTDLVLLQPLAKLRGGIKFRDIEGNKQANTPQGAFLVSHQPDSPAVASVLGSMRFDLARVSSVAFSGATARRDSKPATIYFVRPGSPAAANDIRAGDVVTRLSGELLSNADDFSQGMLKYWPGDTVSIQIKRAGNEMVRHIVLTYPPPVKHNHPAEIFAGGKSLRRDGFNSIYAHDAIIRPDQCGGPAFDISGHFCGINIARFSRAISLFLPSRNVANFINNISMRRTK